MKDKLDGGLGDGMSLSDIADKHNVPHQQIKTEFKKGIKILITIYISFS